MEVLSKIGGLFGGGGGSSATSSVMGKGLLQPDILGQAKDLTSGSGGFNSPQSATTNPIFSENTLDQIAAINKRGQENRLPMMQLNPMNVQPQIQQQDLINLLKNLGGGY